MAAWNLYRYRNSDGSSKDWAVKTNNDGSVSTRWGKTANRLPGNSNRNGIRQSEIEKQKRNKGYVFVSEVNIDVDGNVSFTNQNQNQTAQSSGPDQNNVPEPDTDTSKSPVEALYWHIDCKAENDNCITLGMDVRRMIGEIQAYENLLSPPEQDWDGWQQLIDLTLTPQAFSLSGQIQQMHGVSPCLFLLALKYKGFAGVEIDIATESSREVSADLKAESDVLAFFGADMDSIRPIAEVLGLLKPKLNLASAMSDSDDCWF